MYRFAVASKLAECLRPVWLHMGSAVRIAPWIRLVGVASLAAALVAATGCENRTGPETPNQPPMIEITGGPAAGTREAYTARIYWRGWDEDGVITQYEYALDPPPAFTPEEIADPRGFPGLTVRLIRGPTDYSDTLRVSKTEGGAVHTFDWIETLEYSRSFAFATPQADSMQDGSASVPAGSFSGVHSVYVRARDDDGAYSAPDRLSYTAETIVPEATIRRPQVAAEMLSVGATVTVTWDGIDPDSPDPAKKPIGYVYRLLDLHSLKPPVDINRAQPGHLYRTDGIDSVWTYQSADTLQHTFLLKLPGSYIFGVRAVDAAGAVEPFMELGRNSFKFQSIAYSGSPQLALTEPSLGTFSYRGSGSTFDVEVPLGAVLRFSWTATAEEYGGTIEGYSWGVDVPDLDREGPDSGWSGWGQITSTPPISFSLPGLHVIYVRARDLSGAITLATLILNVIDLPLDKELLLVDDARDRTQPRDGEHDAFWESLFDGSGRLDPGQVTVYATYGENDTFYRSPEPPPLSTLGRYRLIIWECTGDGYNGVSGLWRVTNQTRHLGAYLRAGGMTWIGGTMTVAAMMPGTSAAASFDYPKEVVPGMFPYDFLKLASDRVENAKGGMSTGTRVEDNLIGVLPLPGRPEIYPAMEQDPLKINPYARSIPFGDAIFGAIYTQDIARFSGKLDSLYIYQAVKPNRPYNNKVNALRWHDTDPARRHGRTQWFGFPFYYMKQEQAQETFNRSLDWFREEMDEAAQPE